MADERQLASVADELASAFSQEGASVACMDGLRQLLPGIVDVSVAVAGPGDIGGAWLTVAANLTSGHPAALHLLPAASTAAGLALAHGRPLTAGLTGNGPGFDPRVAAAASALADVRLLLAAAPGAQRVLCVPFGCGACLGPGSCPECGVSGGGASGALLLGLEGPDLDASQLEQVHTLARMLPAGMARGAGDALALASLVCFGGGPGGCRCCCEPVEAPAPAQGGPDAGRCAPGGEGPGGDGGGGPAQALVVPGPGVSEAAAEETAQEPPPVEVPAASNPYTAPAKPGAAAAKPAQSSHQPAQEAAASAHARGADHAGPSSPLSSPLAPQHAFSKGLVAALAEEDGCGVPRQSALSLRFRSEQVEREYARWAASLFRRADRYASIFMLFALLMAAAVRGMTAASIMGEAPNANALCTVASLAASLLMPFALSFAGRLVEPDMYSMWRERLVMVHRLYLVAVACGYDVPPHQLQLGHWAVSLRLGCVEALVASAFGFMLPYHLHVPLQLAGSAIALSSLPHMCTQVHPGDPTTSCLLHSGALLLVLGCLVPTVVLRRAEQRSRATFAGLVGGAVSAH